MDAIHTEGPWRTAFEAFKADDPAASMGASAREAAFGRFEAHGLPTRRHEYWKYTPVRDLSPEAPLPAATDDPFAGIDAYRLVFVDGALDAGRSDREALAAVADVADAKGAPWMEGVFNVVQTGHSKVARPMADLNLAFFSDGLALRVPAGTTLTRPVHLRYEGETPAHLRLELLVEDDAGLTLLESGPGALTTGAEIRVGDRAAVHHLRAQTEARGQQFTNTFAVIGAEALFKSFTLCADGATLRNETVLTMAGADSGGHLAAAVLGRGEAVLDNTVYLSHEAPGCESRQVVKSVLADAARSVFQGKIFVDPVAQKTDGYQISQAVLLSEGAEFDAKPELEIYADDVKCSHGSTSGALNEEALFYLRSRGAPLEVAEAMLVEAFVDEAIIEIDDEALADTMRVVVARWMADRSTNAGRNAG